jgi:hypothetical protein
MSHLPDDVPITDELLRVLVTFISTAPDLTLLNTVSRRWEGVADMDVGEHTLLSSPWGIAGHDAFHMLDRVAPSFEPDAVADASTTTPPVVRPRDLVRAGTFRSAFQRWQLLSNVVGFRVLAPIWRRADAMWSRLEAWSLQHHPNAHGTLKAGISFEKATHVDAVYDDVTGHMNMNGTAECTPPSEHE